MSSKQILFTSALAWWATTTPGFGLDAQSLSSEFPRLVVKSDDLNLMDNSFDAIGHAKAFITGQDANLEADYIRVDQNQDTLEARGHVRIIRHGSLTTGSAFKFKICSEEYLATEPNLRMSRPTLIVSCDSSALKVTDIVVEGNRSLTTAQVLSLIQTKRGDRFSRLQIVKDLKILGASGYFDTERMCCTPELYGNGINLRFRLEEKTERDLSSRTPNFLEQDWIRSRSNNFGRGYRSFSDPNGWLRENRPSDFNWNARVFKDFRLWKPLQTAAKPSFKYLYGEPIHCNWPKVTPQTLPAMLLEVEHKSVSYVVRSHLL